MAFLDPTFLLRRQTAQGLAEIRSKLAEQGFPATFRDEHDMVFALPPGMAQALELVHRASTFRVLGGSRKRASRWTPEYVKLLLSPRHNRGITQVYLPERTQALFFPAGARASHPSRRAAVVSRRHRQRRPNLHERT